MKEENVTISLLYYIIPDQLPAADSGAAWLRVALHTLPAPHWVNP